VNLLLMRHAQAEGASESVSDHDRQLTVRGREVASRIATVLLEGQIVPGLILVSPAARARQTVELMIPALGDVKVKVVKSLYLATPMTILEVIHKHGGGADPLMIVGHNPGLETTISNIAGNIVPFPTAAIAHASIVANQSSEVVAVWRPDELPAG